MSDYSLQQAIIDMKVETVGSLVQTAMSTGRSPFEILSDLRIGLAEVGRRFEEGTYFLSDLIVAAETMKEALSVLRLHLTPDGSKSEGRVLIGTILGDVHDFGKNIVTTLLTAKGFEVLDLGVDIEPERFAQEAALKNVEILGISALLSTTQPLSKEVVQAVRQVGIGHKVKVILGGAAAQKSAPEEYGVDAAVTDALEGVNIIEAWVEGKRKRGN